MMFVDLLTAKCALNAHAKCSSVIPSEISVRVTRALTCSVEARTSRLTDGEQLRRDPPCTMSTMKMPEVRRSPSGKSGGHARLQQ